MGLIPDKFEVSLSPEDRALVGRILSLLERLLESEITLKVKKDVKD